MAIQTALLVLTALACGMWLGLLCKKEILVFLVLGLSGIQFFVIPFGTAYLSLAMVISLGLWRTALPSHNPTQMLGAWWQRWYVALILWQLASIAWAPQPILGFRNFIYSLPFLLVARGVYRVTMTQPRTVKTAWFICAVLIGAQSFAVILFRLLPSVEDHYLRSGLADLFISRNTLADLFLLKADNVLDPTKAGGLYFVNANAASAYLGVCAMVMLAVSTLGGGVAAETAAVAAYLAVAFTGSKAGLIFGALVAPTVGLTLLRRYNIPRRTLLAGILAIIPFATAAIYVIATLRSTGAVVTASQGTLDTRWLIWLFAFTQFVQHPLRGLGYGGWELVYPQYAQTTGLSPNLPPHNIFLILWSQSGLLAVFLGAIFIIALMRRIRREAATVSRQMKTPITFITLAFCWLLFQAMGENFALSEPHMMMTIAAGIGYVLAMQHRARLLAANPDSLNVD